MISFHTIQYYIVKQLIRDIKNQIKLIWHVCLKPHQASEEIKKTGNEIVSFLIFSSFIIYKITPRLLQVFFNHFNTPISLLIIVLCIIGYILTVRLLFTHLYFSVGRIFNKNFSFNESALIVSYCFSPFFLFKIFVYIPLVFIPYTNRIINILGWGTFIYSIAIINFTLIKDE